MNVMKKWLTFTLAVVVFLAAIPAAGATVRFSDVPRTHWAYEAITAMAEKGVIQGYKDGTFRPNNRITRAEFAKIMIAAAGIDITSANQVRQTFADVNRNHWAFYYVELAKPYLTGYKSGSVYTYKPDEYAVREDIAVALVRLAGADQSTKANLSVLSRFDDRERISPALRPYIAIAVQTGLIKGFEDDTFRPQSPITRAEAASLLERARLDETKVVFPDEPKQSQPDLSLNVTDSFSDSQLSQWKQDEASGIWAVVDKQVTAIGNDDDIRHFLLPLKWKESAKPTNYEVQVDVIAKGTDGLGGLFFNGKDGRAELVTIGKNNVTVSQMSDVKKNETTTLAKVAYKLQAVNKLKLVVNKDSYAIYLNDTFVFGQQNHKIEGTGLGLYLHKDATNHLPDKATYFDNFSFRVLDK